MQHEVQVHLTGLSKSDVALCNLLWNDETGRDIDTIIASLPKRKQGRARVMHEMIVAAVIDDVVEKEGNYEAARDVLSGY